MGDTMGDSSALVIPYKPSMRYVLCSVESVIFLSQAHYWWVQSGRTEFYKFNKPCSHKMYRTGDSWVEELCFSDRELRRVKSELCLTVDKAGFYSNLDDENFPVIHRIDSGRVSHYRINKSYYDYLVGLSSSSRDLPYVDYRIYINSDAWRIKASNAKERAGWRCQVCYSSSSTVTLDAHHRTYDRLGNEDDMDITVLCRPCHTMYHERGG